MIKPKTLIGYNATHPASEQRIQDMVDAGVRVILNFPEHQKRINLQVGKVEHIIYRDMREGHPNSGDTKMSDWLNHLFSGVSLAQLQVWHTTQEDAGGKFYIQIFNEQLPTKELGLLERQVADFLGDWGLRYLALNAATGSYEEKHMKAWYEGFGVEYKELLPDHVTMGFHEGAGPREELAGLPWAWMSQWQDTQIWPLDFPSLPSVPPMGEECFLSGKYQYVVHKDQPVIISEWAWGPGWRDVMEQWFEHGLEYTDRFDFMLKCVKWIVEFYEQDPRIKAVALFCADEHWNGEFKKDALFPDEIGYQILDYVKKEGQRQDTEPLPLPEPIPEPEPIPVPEDYVVFFNQMENFLEEIFESLGTAFDLVDELKETLSDIQGANEDLFNIVPDINED